MTPRERVLTALNHEEPDRVPLFLGASGATLDDLDRYPWPDLLHPSRFEGLAARCKAIHDAGYASVLRPFAGQSG